MITRLPVRHRQSYLTSSQSMSCPISKLLVRLPAMNEDCRNSIKLRISQKQQKLTKLRINLAQTCRQDIRSRATLSEAIIQTRGALRELKILLARTPTDQYKLEPAGRFVIHSCPSPPTHTPIEMIDLTDSTNNQEVEIIGFIPGNNSPSP